MAHVQITKAWAGDTLHVSIDGVDITDHIYDGTLAFVKVGDDPFSEWGIQMVIAADSLNVDPADRPATQRFTVGSRAADIDYGRLAAAVQARAVGEGQP